MPILLKVTYRFNEISIKIPMNFLKIEKKSLNFYRTIRDSEKNNAI